MKNDLFNVAELIDILKITEDEAKYLISGDAEIEKAELERLAEYKGLSYEDVCEIFGVAM